jgi:hypothetical protein
MDFRRPFRTDFVLDGWWPCASTQTPWVWLISGCPVGTNAAAKIIFDGRLGHLAFESLQMKTTWLILGILEDLVVIEEK